MILKNIVSRRHVRHWHQSGRNLWPYVFSLTDSLPREDLIFHFAYAKGGFQSSTLVDTQLTHAVLAKVRAPKHNDQPGTTRTPQAPVPLPSPRKILVAKKRNPLNTKFGPHEIELDPWDDVPVFCPKGWKIPVSPFVRAYRDSADVGIWFWELFQGGEC